jgi:hypothetical protein
VADSNEERIQLLMLFEPAVDRYRHCRRSGGSNGRAATFDRDRIRDPLDKTMFGRLGFIGRRPNHLDGPLSIIVATDSFVSQVTDRKHYATLNRYTAFDHRHRVGIPAGAMSLGRRLAATPLPCCFCARNFK